MSPISIHYTEMDLACQALLERYFSHPALTGLVHTVEQAVGGGRVLESAIEKDRLVGNREPIIPVVLATEIAIHEVG